jgi:uncharacterized membrane protein YoaK (UPF0700 family)
VTSPAGLDSAASLPEVFQNDFAAMESVMKKVSIVGLILGALLGAVAALMAGGWLFWLGAGLVLGVMIGSTQARVRGRMQRSIQRRDMSAGSLHS